MAYSIKIQGLPLDQKNPVWSIDAVSWPADALQADPRFREIWVHGEIEYIAILLPKEFLEIQNKYAEDSPVDSELNMQIQNSMWIVVHIYFWCSGLG